MLTLDTYNQKQIKEILQKLGVAISSETSKDFMCLCPFHSNHYTPSFAVSYDKGLYVCYNPACNAKGKLLDLVMKVGQKNHFQAIRMIEGIRSDIHANIESEINDMLEDKPKFIEFPQDKIDELKEQFWENEEAKAYMLSRKMNDETLDYFDVGYSSNMGMVTVPLHSPTGMPVGIIGRSIKDKKFKNSTDLPRSYTLFNLHNAKKEGGTIIVCESSFDAMRIHQSGYPNVVATLGGSISKENLSNLDKYSSSIIIATDADDAGRKLGKEITNNLKHKNIMWASYDYEITYPNGAKDVGDLNDSEIKQCIKNAVSTFEYFNW
jgi:DNA primase